MTILSSLSSQAANLPLEGQSSIDNRHMSNDMEQMLWINVQKSAFYQFKGEKFFNSSIICNVKWKK